MIDDPSSARIVEAIKTFNHASECYREARRCYARATAMAGIAIGCTAASLVLTTIGITSLIIGGGA